MAFTRDDWSDDWLFDIHKELWKRDRNEELIHTAYVTLDRLNKLQETLAAQFPNHNEEDYVAQSDVSSTKLSCFTVAFRQQNLRLVALMKNLKKTNNHFFLPARMPAAMLLREDQETMSRILAQREDGVAESCLITEPEGPIPLLAPEPLLLTKGQKTLFQMANPSITHLPAMSSAEPSDSTPKQNEPVCHWLSELHDKLWGREDLRDLIFRTTEVTIAHYAELQSRLNEKFPHRNEDSYVATDVSSIKLEVLRNFVPPNTTTALPTRSQTRSMNCPELSIKLEELLPVKIQYLDLSPLNLTARFRAPLTILIRHEYKAVTDVLDAGEKNVNGSCFITGQRGIGKMAYLYVALVERLLKGQKTLFQIGDLIYAISDTVQLDAKYRHFRDFAGEDRDIVGLVDAQRPRANIMLSRVILTSSANDPESRKWLSQLPSPIEGDVYLMDCWSYEELALAAIFLHPFDLTFPRLSVSVEYFGISPVVCFGTAVSLRQLDDKVQSIKQTIRRIPRSTGLYPIVNNARIGSSLSQRLFQVYPADKDHISPCCPIRPASEWILDQLLDEFDGRKKGSVREFYVEIQRRLPPAEPIQHMVWQRQVHCFFKTVKSPFLFQLRSLDDNTSMDWGYPDGVVYESPRTQMIPARLQEHIQARIPCYIKLMSPTFTSINSLLYEPDRLVCIRIMETIDVSAMISGLQTIQAWASAAATELKPTSERPWIILLVVPEEKAGSIAKQTLQGPSGLTEEWGKTIKQYVLGLSAAQMWG